MTNQSKFTPPLDAEMGLLNIKQATETLFLISLAIEHEGSVERINAGLSTVMYSLRSEINKLGAALGYGSDIFHNGVE